MGCIQVKYNVVKNLSNKYPINKLCNYLGVSRAGYYKHLKSIESPKKQYEYRIVQDITECQEKVRYTYGYRRMTIYLKEKYNINHKAVLRLMKKYALLSRSHRVKKYKTLSRESNKYEDVLKRKFSSNKPNEIWLTDITEVNAKDGKLYVSAIKDIYDGAIVGCIINDSCPTSTVISTFESAFNDYRSKSENRLIVHSDQGTQYTSYEYKNFMESNNVRLSMSKPGTPIDNAPMESFFSTMKMEWIIEPKTLSKKQLRKEIISYIEFYNKERIRTSIKMAPLSYRQLSA